MTLAQILIGYPLVAFAISLIIGPAIHELTHDASDQDADAYKFTTARRD